MAENSHMHDADTYWFSAVMLSEWHPHCILLWDCDVTLYLAQCD